MDYEWVGRRAYCRPCYREGFQAQCAYCRDWFDKGRLMENGECGACDQAAREMEEWNVLGKQDQAKGSVT